MNPFHYIWNAATFNRLPIGKGCIVVIVGLISMIFGACSTATEMTLCSRNESMPCVLRYGETTYVCPGDPASANMTLRVDANTIPQNVSILVKDDQFSKGLFVSGEFHNGDKAIKRWKNRISFQGNTMTYELWNSEIQFRDEFKCRMEIDIEGKNFTSKLFKWFHVDRNNCITEPPCIKDTTEQNLDNITEQLRETNTHLQSCLMDVADNFTAIQNLTVLMNSLASDMADVAETTKEIKNLTVSSDQAMQNKLDSLEGIGIGGIILSALKMLFITVTIVLVCCVLACKRDQPGSPSNNPNTDDDLQLPVYTLSPQDEVHNEAGATGV